MELAKVWFSTAHEYFKRARMPRKDVILRQLLQPCKLTSLQEHKDCFQQWNVLQLWIGITSTLVILLISFIWFLLEEHELAKPPISAILLNAIVGLVLLFFFTYLAWFSVISKDGCCCCIVFCCEGKPNLLVVAILSVLFGIGAILNGIQAIGLAKGAMIIAVIIVAFFALIHGVALLYLGFEAGMVWKLSIAGPDSQPSAPAKVDTNQAVVGVPQGVERVGADVEEGDVKVEA
jgi:hypothetical protein